MDFFLQFILSPLLIIVIGKYIDNKYERHRIRQQEERQAEMAKEQEIRATLALVSVGIMSVLRDRILQSCRYYIGKGSIESLSLENITKMHDSYKALGGNGLCDHQYEELQKLPVIE